MASLQPVLAPSGYPIGGADPYGESAFKAGEGLIGHPGGVPAGISQFVSSALKGSMFVPPTVRAVPVRRLAANLAANAPAGGTGSSPSTVSGPLPKGLSGIAAVASKFVGVPYLWGGTTPSGFDCSGLLQYAAAQNGIHISRTTYTQWKEGRAVSFPQLRPGDAVFFKGGDSIGGLPGHVGIYIGHGLMVDAPHTGANVRIESVANFGGYMGARRYGK